MAAWWAVAEIAAVAVGAVSVVAGLVGVVVKRLFAVITVDGLSMQPTLDHGDRLLVRRRPGDRIRSGQIVLVQRPDPTTGWPAAGARPNRVDGAAWYVKRAVAVAGDPVTPELAARCVPRLGQRVPADSILVIGDNPRSDDSKQWGYCPDRLVFGVVLRQMRSVVRRGPEAGATGPEPAAWPVPPRTWRDEDEQPEPSAASRPPGVG